MTKLATKALRPTAETGLVRCPEPGCGCPCVHPVEVVVNSGGVITGVDGEGTSITQGEATGRVVTTWLRFQCEWGHDFEVVFRFHKGETEFEVVSRGESRDIRATIWRD